MKILLLIGLLSLVGCAESNAKKERREASAKLNQIKPIASVGIYDAYKFEDKENNTTCYVYNGNLSCVKGGK
jgi:uncharacterized protein YcfL